MEKLAVLRYARAIFDLAVEKDLVEQYSQAARGILDVITQDNDFMPVINNPSIPSSEKLGAIQAAFGNKVPDDFLGLFALVLKRGREDELEGILRHFDVLYMDHKRQAVAVLYAPEELPDDKVAEIRQLLGKKLGKTVEIKNVIDPALIAGFRVEVDGFVFDASTKNQVDMLKKQLLAR